MFRKLPTASKAEVRITLVVLTAVAMVCSVCLSVVALWLTTSGDPDALVPEHEIWANTIFFSALIPGIVCPLVVHTLLSMLRELHAARAELDRLARHDALTGLFNRRGFDDAAASLAAWATARSEPLAALLCDIDHFKRINDTHGHACGDGAIGHVSALLRSMPTGGRPVVLGRQGGEEFAAVLGGATPVEVAMVAEALRASVAATPFVWDGQPVAVTISIGTSFAPPGTATVPGLLSRADKALYAAKEAGRNRVVATQPPLAA